MANKMYFTQSNFVASKFVTVPPIAKRKIEIPTASELFLKTAEIIKAIVAIIKSDIEFSK